MGNIMKYLLLLLSVFSSVAKANSLDPNWLKIMHYEQDGNSYENRVNNLDFFFNLIKKNSAKKEFEAQKKFFMKEKFGSDDLKLICNFPMRVKYFSKLLKRKISMKHCQEYIDFKKLLDFKSIKFIYASSFPNNPASMFGHTLINLSNGEREPTLESVSISYMAQPNPNDSVPLYYYRGLTGGYNGKYQISRFYDILKLYQKQEDRNLWYFDIETTKEQREDLLALLWEAQKSLEKPYLFFNKNCSYELLSLLYAAGIIEDFRSTFGIFTMPLETYKKVAEQFGNRIEEKVFISNINNIERQIAKFKPKETAEAICEYVQSESSSR